MLNDLNYLSMKDNGFIPYDVQEVSKELIEKSIYTFSSLNSVDSSQKDFGLVVDNYQWIVYSHSTGIIYSSDGDYVYGYHNISDEEGEYIKYLLRDKLIPINKTKINRRNDKMADKNEIQARIAKLKEEQEKKAAAGGAPMTDSNAFNDTKVAGEKKAPKVETEEERLKRLEAEAKRDDLNKAIKNLAGGVQLQDTTDLYAYNGPRSSLIGWLVDRDTRLHAKATEKVIIDPLTKQPKVVLNAPQEVKDLVASGKRPAKDYLEKTVSLKVNQMAPGAAKFAIVEMPIDGAIPIDKLRDPNYKIEVDFKSKSDKVIKFLNKKEFAATVISLIGGSIKEDERTYDEPSIVNVFLVGKPVTDKETGRTENKLTPSITVASKRKLLTKTNYFPKITFATMNLDSINSEEARKKANLSLFGHLFRSIGGKATPYSKLDAAEKAKIIMENGQINSKFFDPADSIPLNVSDVFTGASIANPAIPLKEEVPTKDGKSTRLVPVTFDVTRSTEDQYGIDPFKDPRFARILNACGGKLTKEVVTELYSKSKRRPKGAGAGIILSPEEATKAYLNAANASEDGNSALKNISFSDALSSDEMKSFATEALQSLSNYYAK